MFPYDVAAPLQAATLFSNRNLRGSIPSRVALNAFLGLHLRGAAKPRPHGLSCGRASFLARRHVDFFVILAGVQGGSIPYNIANHCAPVLRVAFTFVVRSAPQPRYSL